MRWSVLLPTHDSADTLALALGSVLAQTDTDFELLVVGDGVGDDTRAVLASIDDGRIRFLDRPKTAGFGYESRRTALEQAAGAFVAFMSDDDLWGPRHLEQLGAELDDGHDLAYSRPLWCVPSGHIVPLSFDLRDPSARAMFTTTNFVPAPCVAATRSAIERAGGWPTDVDHAADWHLWRRILDRDDASVGYVREGSAIHFRARRRSIDHFAVDAVLQYDGADRWWPEACLVSAPPGVPLQVVVAGAAPDWWCTLDVGVNRIEHHLALDASLRTQVRLELAAADSAAAERYAELDAAYRSSLSWRVTRPLRWAASRARSLGRPTRTRR